MKLECVGAITKALADGVSGSNRSEGWRVANEESQPDPQGDGKAPKKPGFSAIEKQLLVGATILITLFAFESLAVTTVMPTVLDDLGGKAWLPISSGAPLAMQVVSSAAAGPLVGRRGPRAVLLAGLTLFAVGLTLSGLAPTIQLFVTGRALQGLGAGLATVPFFVLVGAIASPLNRPRFFAVFSMAWVLPSLVGPPIAGFTVELIGWRPIFWAVPILLVAVTASLAPLLAGLERQRSPVSNTVMRQVRWGLIAGIALVSAQASSSLEGSAALVLLVVSFAIALVALSRLLPPGTLRLHAGIPSVVATRGLAVAAQVSATALVPMVLQDVQAWTPAAASLAVGAGSVSWAGGSYMQSRIRARRTLLPLVGTVFVAVGLALLLFLPTALAIWPIGLGGVVVAGFGIGTTHATLSDLALGALPEQDHAMISSALQVADTAGPALALSLTAAAFLLAEITGFDAWIVAFAASLMVAVLAVAAARKIPEGLGVNSGAHSG